MTNRKLMTDRELTRMRCNDMMREYNFSWFKKAQSVIWAAKGDACPECKAQPNFPCRNLADIQKGAAELRINKQPHDSRINWYKLLEALKAKYGE